jgi:hypothetical protein
MLIQTLNNGAKNDEEYKIKIMKSMKKNIFLSVVGVVTIVIAILMATKTQETAGSFLSGVFVGTGAVVLVFCLKQVQKSKKILADEKLLHTERLKASDERNQMIMEKTMYWSGTLVMGACYAIMLLAGFFNMAVFWTLWSVILAYCVTTVVVKKYYEKKL